jgi:hypothetical protein
LNDLVVDFFPSVLPRPPLPPLPPPTPPLAFIALRIASKVASVAAFLASTEPTPGMSTNTDAINKFLEKCAYKYYHIKCIYWRKNEPRFVRKSTYTGAAGKEKSVS